MIAHWSHASVVEALGWGVVWAALLFAGAWYGEAAGTRLARVLHRAVRAWLAYGRRRAALMRRPSRAAHRHAAPRAHRPRPRRAALLAATLAHFRFHYSRGASR